MRVPSSVQLKTPRRSWKMRKPGHWHVNISLDKVSLKRFVSTPSMRASGFPVVILFAASSRRQGLLVVLAQFPSTARFCREFALTTCCVKMVTIVILFLRQNNGHQRAR